MAEQAAVTEPLVVGRGGAVAKAPDRANLAHFRALMAFDARSAGASELEIAALFHAPDVLKQSWTADSAVRALVRDALKRARAYLDHRWTDLVWPKGR